MGGFYFGAAKHASRHTLDSPLYRVTLYRLLKFGINILLFFIRPISELWVN